MKLYSLGHHSAIYISKGQVTYKSPIIQGFKRVLELPVSNGKTDIRQRSREGKVVVFTTTPIALSGFSLHPGHVVASLDKTLYNDCLCLVARNKQQIQWARMRRNPQEHWITGNF